MIKTSQRITVIAFGMLFSLQASTQAFDRITPNLIEAQAGDTRINLIGDSSRVIGIDYGADGTIDDVHDTRDGELKIDCSRVPGIEIGVAGPIGTGAGEVELYFLSHEHARIYGTIDGALELTLVGDGSTVINELRAISAEIGVADGQQVEVNGAGFNRDLHVSWFIFNRLAAELPTSDVTLNAVQCDNLIADHQYGQNNESLTVNDADIQDTFLVESRHPMSLQVQRSVCRNFDLSDRSSAGTWNILLGMGVQNSAEINIAQRNSLITIDASSRFGRSTRIDTGDGSTALSCEGSYRGDVQITCGSTLDTIMVGNAKGGTTMIDGTLQITNAGNRTLNTGQVLEWVDVSNVEIADSLSIETGLSADGVVLADVSVMGFTTIDTSSGDDRVEVRSSLFAGDVELNGDTGRDFGDEDNNLFFGSFTAKDFERGNLR